MNSLRNALAFFVVAFFLLFLFTAVSADPDRSGRRRARVPDVTVIQDDGGLIQGRVIGCDKADSLLVYGAAGTLQGKFQTIGGNPDLQGWTPLDQTVGENHWHVSTQWAANLDPDQTDNHAWWCGDTYPGACAEGYGPNYFDPLGWLGTVADPSAGVQVKLTGVMNVSIPDVGYDLLILQTWTSGGWWDIQSFDGQYQGYPLDLRFWLVPADYVGPGSDQVHLRWLFDSDSVYDDEDCQIDSEGAAQIDLLKVEFQPDGQSEFYQVGTVETCEAGDPLQWFPGATPYGAGNFGQVWPLLDDVDPCGVNNTPQVAFIDDGVVVPGTGGYLCTNHCYGPGNYIVNPEGGLAGPDHVVDAMVASPVFAWPGPHYDAAILSFDVYRHQPLDQDSPGMVYYWKTRASEASEDINDLPWVSNNFVYAGGPEYIRETFNISPQIPTMPQQIQVSLGVLDYGQYLGLYGTDGTPAPYFDNVRLVAYKVPGPGLSAYNADQAQDNFPAIGGLDLENLANNSVRFDSAYNTAPSWHYANTPGDSVVVVNSNPTTAMDGVPTLNYRLFPNPLFDPYRTAVPPGSGNSATEGSVASWAIEPAAAEPRFAADLPDAGFFFPGDIIHYYFRAVDTEGNISILPPDTTGFSTVAVADFDQNDLYDPHFTVRGLPSVNSTYGAQPEILVWDDSGSPSELAAWLYSLSDLGLTLGIHYDLYRTREPRRGYANGLGGRATYLHLDNYHTLMYSSGEQDTMTITPADAEADIGDDLGLLMTWLNNGQRTALFMGDHLVSDLWFDDQPAGQSFMEYYLGVSWQGRDVRPEIGDQTMPWVYPEPGDPVFSPGGWGVDGDCPRINRFDHIQAQDPGVRAAQFATPGGAIGVYDPAAVVRCVLPAMGSETYTVPYGLMPLTDIAELPGRSSDKGVFLWFLADILQRAGHELSSTPQKFGLSLKAHPNPFNPRTEIHFSVHRKGTVTLDLYDVRGRRVRRLLNEVRLAGDHLAVWDGRSDEGRPVASGVYFCIMEAAEDRRVLKLTMIR